MAKSKEAGKSKGVSRRELFQGAAAAAILTAAGQLSAKGEEAKNKTASCDVATVDTKSYHALALWLTLTTNPNLLLCKQADIESGLGLNPGDLGKGWSRVSDSTPFPHGASPQSPAAMYDMVRSDFLSAINGVYTGPDCPKSLAPIIAISKLYQ